MTLVFIEAAARSLLLGLAVVVGLRIFRVRNVPAQKATWSLVLVSALAMPLLLPVMTRWHLLPTGVNVVLPADPIALLEDLQTNILAKSSAGKKLPDLAASTFQSNPQRSQESFVLKQEPAPNTKQTLSLAARTHRAAEPGQDAPFAPNSFAPSSAQLVVNNVSPVGGSRFPASIRHNLIDSPISLALMLYYGITALLIARLALGLFTTIRLWRTAKPVPTHLLPHDAASLPIRASSKVASPLTIGSSILLPADYTNWDREKLRIVLAHERSHIRQGDFYLQILSGLYAALVWFSPLGWWLKHELTELAEAISDRAAMQEATSRTSYAQILLEFAATPRRISIGVAMARPGSLSRRIERLLNDNSFRQCFAGGRRALIAVALVPLALFASTTLVRVQAATGTQSASPLPIAAPAAHATTLGNKALPQLPGTLELKAPASTSAPEMVAAASPAPVVRRVAEGAQEDGSLSFDRTLSVSGAAQLSVSTGSGNIHITRSSGNQIHIYGKISVSENGNPEQARQIATNPPIEQNGDVVRVGQHQEQWKGISIDFKIEAPEGTILTANSGSGDIVDEGVGRNAKFQTGSGNIRANGLEGALTVKSGSGDIVATQTGQGDVVLETGSGDIEIKGIHGGLHGRTGSGDIKASGTPSASWALQSGSGDISLWTNNAPFTLDASTGSGSVTTEHQMVVQGSFDRHHIRGTVNGGGPTIQVQTGSGEIQIH